MIKLPPNCPPKLRKVIEEHNGKRWKIAEHLRVNVYYVQEYIKKGKEPSNKTVRERMHFPKSRRKERVPNYRPEHVNWWRHLSPEVRDEWTKFAHNKAKEIGLEG